MLYFLNAKNKYKKGDFDMKVRIFSVMQYEVNPKTGENLNFNERNIISALSHKSIKQWAYICHDEDRFTDKDFDNDICTKEQVGELKGKHWHIVCRCDSPLELHSIANWFGVPENFIDVPKGRGAFLDCVMYLTHETQKAQEEGKFHYADDKVKSNFDFRKEIDNREERRLKYGGDLTKEEEMIYDVRYNGKTLKQCRIDDELLYLKIEEKLKKKRLLYIADMEMPNTRLNYYITGKGGYGKDVASRALARSLFPQLSSDDEIFFEVGGDNVTFEGYDGQPVIIWSERRASKLLDDFKGRENLFKVFDSHPHNAKVNIKYGSVKLVNTVNIVNSVQDYKEFLDGLAGEYVDKEGVLHKAEDKGQSYRRFPIIMPLHTMDIDILFSKYFTGESNNPSEYEQWKRICGSFRKVRVLCKNNEELARMVEGKMLSGLPEKSKELLENEVQLTEEEILKALEHYGEEIIVVENKEEKKEIDLVKLATDENTYKHFCI